MKITFCTFESWPGVVTCLENIKSLVKKRQNVEILDRSFNTQNLPFSLIKELKTTPPDFLFLGGWDNRIRTIVQNCLPQTKVVLMWCSPICQIDLGGEISRFFDAISFLNSGSISYIGIPVETDYNILKEMNKNFKFLPIYMDENELNENTIENNVKNELVNFDIFCAPCQRKNIISQLFALHGNKNKVKLNINYDKSNVVASQYIAPAQSLFPNLENHPWGSRKEYLSLIQKMDFGMQVSMSESFNYVCAEHMFYGIPMVMSNVNPYSNYKEISSLVVNDHQNVQEIYEKTKPLINDFVYRKEMGECSRNCIIDYNRKIKIRLEESLLEIMG